MLSMTREINIIVEELHTREVDSLALEEDQNFEDTYRLQEEEFSEYIKDPQRELPLRPDEIPDWM